MYPRENQCLSLVFEENQLISSFSLIFHVWVASPPGALDHVADSAYEEIFNSNSMMKFISNSNQSS